MSTKKVRPEWTPDNAGKEFTTDLMSGVSLTTGATAERPKRKFTKPKQLSVAEYTEAIKRGDRVALSKAITLVESNSLRHAEKAQDLLKELMPLTGNSIRIGISGPPGVGKSTFIESLGTFLTRNGIKLAVLAVDPSSTVTGGSILGDKTRMENLSRDPNAYIRPSPSAGTLGGVARKTRETILLCEAAGYEVILIETIGVGQSEITVRSMVDIFMLLLQPGSGDELQGIKKGVVEIADILVVNKAEGKNKALATATQREYKNALNLLSAATEGWKSQVLTCSAINDIGIEDIWSTVNNYLLNTKESAIFYKRRKNQMLEWFHDLLKDSILQLYFSDESYAEKIQKAEQQILNATVTPTKAVFNLMGAIKDGNFSSNEQ